MSWLRKLGTGENGQDLLEYGLLASLIAIMAVAAVQVVSTQIVDVLWGIVGTLQF